MDINFFKSWNHEKKIFLIFLIIHFIVWSTIGLIRVVLPTDALEGIYWGSFHDFGTPKHPPLFGWLAYITYIPHCDYLIYMISQFFIILGFIYIYKLAKNFLDDNQAILSVMLLEGCWCYSYITGYYGFNPDVIILFTLPAISYYFYKCITQNDTRSWIILGILTGFSFLNKYQTALLIIPMFIWTCIFKRDIFKNKFFYTAVAIAFLIFLPHIAWLVKYDFFPFRYFDGELTSSGWLNHITAPLHFIIMQISVIAGIILIYALLKYKLKSPFKLCTEYDKKDIWFLLLLGLTSFFIHVTMGLIEGGTMRPRWGYEFWFLTGIMLFYFFPCKTDKQAFIYTTKCVYTVMLIIFISLGTLLSVEKNYRSRYPVDKVFKDLKEFWIKEHNVPLKYIGGYIEWTLPLTIYVDTHPKALLDTYGYPDPWINYNDLKASGALIIDRTAKKVIKETHKSCPYIKDDDIRPLEYRFNVQNAFGQSREYQIYYYIVPPM